MRKRYRHSKRPVPKEQFYLVETILDRRETAEGSFEYLVKWQGYTAAENTWEPASNLENVAQLVREFDLNLDH